MSENTEKTRRKPKKADPSRVKKPLKSIPPPPIEHAYELKMEKRLKRFLEEQKGAEEK